MSYDIDDFHGRENLEARRSWCPKERGGGKNSKSSFTIIPKSILHDISLNPSEKLCFCVLLDYIRPIGKGRCNPRVVKIAAETGLSERQTRRALDVLWDRWFIFWKRTGKSSVFRVYTPLEHESLLQQNGVRSEHEKQLKAAQSR